MDLKKIMTKEKCLHDINQPNHTVVLSTRLVMLAPLMRFGYCKVCGKSLTYIKDEDGKFYEVKEGELDENIRTDAE